MILKKTPKFFVGHSALCSGLLCKKKTKIAYHRFVKTTPNPRATKNNKGELVGPLLLPAIDWEGEGVGKADVMEAINDGDNESDGICGGGGGGGRGGEGGLAVFRVP